MTKKINWTLNVQVTGGPKISDSATVISEAYGEIQVTVKAGDSAKKVEIAPGSKDDQVQFLLVTSSLYDEKLSYTVNAGTTTIKLDGPHVLIGKGAVGLLSSKLQTLSFTNGYASTTTGKDATITILVGRDATP